MPRITLFGRPALRFDDEPRAWPAPRRAAELLGWLALHPGPHARAELAPRFWPDVLDASARASLRTALHDLRDALGADAPAVVATTRGSVALADGVAVDAREFRAAIRAGRDADAVDLATAELLLGIDAEWAWAARDEYRDELGLALGRLADRHAESGEPAEAVRCARRRVAGDPLSEDAARQLMRILAESGDGAAALREYEQVAARLAKSLRTAPSAATRALAVSLGSGSDAPGSAPAAPPAVPAASALPAPPALTRPPRTVLAGRERELERLGAALERCSGGRGGLVLLEGHAGAGKSRLSRELAAAGRERGIDLMLGRCLEDPVAPYHPFADALGAAAAAGAALAETAGPLGGELARLVPRLAEPAGAPAPVAAEPALARLRLFEAVTACLVNRPRPLLLVLEDLHWADADSLRLLEHVVRGAADAPLLVLGTARPTAPALAAALSALEREGAAERIEVTDLDRACSDALVAAWLGDALDPEAAADLYARTSGNPFYLEEALRDLAESGTHGARGVPRTVRGVVRQRIARLGSATESALIVGAVAGRRFSLDTVEPLAGGEGVLEALERAVDANLLVEDPRAPGEFAFAHALVREAVYEDVSLARRARLHVRLAEQLERDDAPRRTRAAEIAHHRLQSGRTEDVAQAGTLLREAADLARDALSYERAASLYGRALTSATPEGRERATLLLELGRARVRAGDAAGGRDAFRAAAAEARTLGDGRLTAEAALGFGGLGVSILDVDAESVALLDEALDRLPASTPRLRSRCLSRLAVELYYSPGRDRSLALSAEALELAGRENEPLTLLHALNARHVALWTPDHPHERLALAERMVTLAAEADLPELELQGRNWRVADLFELGRLDEQDREIDAHARLVEDLRLAAYRWWAPAWRAGRALLRGDFSAAERLTREARDAAAAGDRNAERARRQLALGLAFTRGRWDEAPLADIERLVAASPATIAWRTALAWILAELGDAAGADAHLALLERDGFAAPRDANWPSAVVEAAEACAIVGRTGLARRLYALLEPFGGRIAPSGRGIHCLGAYDRVRGRLATVLGEPDRADAHFRDAAGLERRLGARPWLLRTLSHHADVLRRRAGPDDGDRAASLLAEAAAVADAIGVLHHADPAPLITARARSGDGR